MPMSPTSRPEVMVFSAAGLGAEAEVGRLLADRLDAVSLGWVDAEVGGGDATARAAVAIESVIGDGAIVVVVIGSVANAVLDAVTLHPGVAAVALIGAPLSEVSVGLLTGWEQVPVVAVADTNDVDAVVAAVATYCASTHPDSDLEIVSDLEIDGESFGSTSDAWRLALDTVVDRLCRCLANIAVRDDVVVTTSDGWEIHGTLAVPRRAEPVPAVVLLHSGRSDRAVFARLERLLTRRGVAAFSIDWRGRGLSQNVATYFELSGDQRAEGWRDAAAAVDALAVDPRIDGERIAMVGVVHGAEHAVAGSIGDPRVRLLALLTGFVPRTEEERAHLVSGDIDVLYVTCEGHGPVTAAMEELVAATPPGRATIRRYPGGAIGYQLFDIDPEFEVALAEWVATGLGADQGVVA